MPEFFEFFAGGGMARLGLGPAWRCAFANEICEKKAAAYRAFFGQGPELLVLDVAELSTADLTGTPALVWASFPCQDLSLAGAGAGLNGRRSGTFRPFWNLMRSLGTEGRAPRLIVLENVTGAITSHAGADFETIIASFAEAGYRAGAMIVDAVRFLPQSRPRLFIIGVHDWADLPSGEPSEAWHTASLQTAHARLPETLQQRWVWWNPPIPDAPVPALPALLEDNPAGVEWHTRQQTERLIALMSPLHRRKLEHAMSLGRRAIGTVYKRTRQGAQQAEVRFDQVSGCLRTPAGGSSRQTVLIVEGERVRSRLLSPREAARLMGVPDSYPLPANYNEAYHLFGDGLAVPVVSWLSEHILLPLAHGSDVCGAGASPAADAPSACSVGQTRRARRPPQAGGLPHHA